MKETVENIMPVVEVCILIHNECQTAPFFNPYSSNKAYIYESNNKTHSSYQSGREEEG
jgi:hypothetical protein